MGDEGAPSSAIRRAASFLFGLRKPIDRRTYAFVGASLMVFKYAVDAAAVYAVTHRFFTPLDYLNPIFVVRKEAVGSTELMLALAIWSLPFLWIGIALSVRRCVDAGQSPWLALMFLIPVVNYAFMVFMCVPPSRPAVPASPLSGDWQEQHSQVTSALFGVAAAVVLGLMMMLVSVYVLGGYGASLFLGTPFLMGAVSAFIHNRRHERSGASTMATALAAVAITGLAMLLFAIEGALCIAMAAPPAFIAAAIGSLVGRGMTLASAKSPPIALSIVILPVLAWTETLLPTTQREARTSIHIQASPEAVFPHLTQFSELPTPTSWWFQLGIAHPRRARIVGKGVGAVRYCEFSTGPFVEPITVWDEPRRLAFDVTAQPPPLKEWSPYGAIGAPHLDDYLLSRRGQFRLERLADGSTLLEGTTWYEVKIQPEVYWGLWSDGLIHGIHREVLEHIKRESESRG